MVDNIVHLCVWRVRWQLWHPSSSSSDSCLSLSLYLARACCPGFTNKLGRRQSKCLRQQSHYLYLSPLADLSFLKDEDLLIFPSFCMIMVLGLMPLSTQLLYSETFNLNVSANFPSVYISVLLAVLVSCPHPILCPFLSTN